MLEEYVPSGGVSRPYSFPSMAGSGATGMSVVSCLSPRRAYGSAVSWVAGFAVKRSWALRRLEGFVSGWLVSRLGSTWVLCAVLRHAALSARCLSGCCIDGGCGARSPAGWRRGSDPDVAASDYRRRWHYGLAQEHSPGLADSTEGGLVESCSLARTDCRVSRTQMCGL